MADHVKKIGILVGGLFLLLSQLACDLAQVVDGCNDMAVVKLREEVNCDLEEEIVQFGQQDHVHGNQRQVVA